MGRDAVGRRASSHAGAVARRFFGSCACASRAGLFKATCGHAWRWQCGNSLQRQPAKLAHGSGHTREITRRGARRVQAVRRPVDAPHGSPRDQASHASCIVRTSGSVIEQAARGWRGNTAVGLAPRRRVSGRREPMPEDTGAGNRKIIASVTATQQGSARLAVRALRCRQRVQSMVSACGDASWRNWNLPLSLKSQSSNSSSCPRPFSNLPGGSGNGAARRKVASAVLSASSSPLLR